MSTPSDLSSPPEFSRPIETESLSHGTTEKKLEASREECEALKERFSIDKLKQLSAILQLARTGSGKRLKVTVSGHLNATLSQTCVVTLEPFETEISTEFQTLFDVGATETDENWDLDLQDDDPPEPIVDGLIDLGELIAQSLSLEINQHPRKPGLDNNSTDIDQANHSTESNENQNQNPFAVLKNMKFDPQD